jgi:hypothetical protein
MSGRYSCLSSWSVGIEAIVCAGTPGRAGGPWWHGHTAANLPGACLDVGLCCLWLGGSAELRRVPHCTPVPMPGCGVHVWAVHPGADSSPWQLSWLCHVRVDLRYLLWRVCLWQLSWQHHVTWMYTMLCGRYIHVVSVQVPLLPQDVHVRACAGTQLCSHVGICAVLAGYPNCHWGPHIRWGSLQYLLFSWKIWLSEHVSWRDGGGYHMTCPWREANLC